MLTLLSSIEALLPGCGNDRRESRHRVWYTPAVMPDAGKNRENWAVWVGSLLALVAVLCNVVFFVNLPGLWAIAWLSMLLSVVALIFLGLGLKHAFGRPVVYRRKILSSVLSLVSLLLVGVAIFASFSARAMPTSAGAPQIGQRVPDFTLADTNDHPVSLAQLLAQAANDSKVMPAKSVLLIFYRGYW